MNPGTTIVNKLPDPHPLLSFCTRVRVAEHWVATNFPQAGPHLRSTLIGRVLDQMDIVRQKMLAVDHVTLAEKICDGVFPVDEIANIVQSITPFCEHWMVIRDVGCVFCTKAMGTDDA